MDLRDIRAEVTGNFLNYPKDAARKVGVFALRVVINAAEITLGAGSRFISLTPAQQELTAEDYRGMQFRTKQVATAEETPFDMTQEEVAKELFSRPD